MCADTNTPSLTTYLADVTLPHEGVRGEAVVQLQYQTNVAAGTFYQVRAHGPMAETVSNRSSVMAHAHSAIDSCLLIWSLVVWCERGSARTS